MDSYKLLANAQLLTVNPVLSEDAEVQQQYYHYISRMVRPWSRKKYVRAQLQFYARVLHALESSPRAKVVAQTQQIRDYFYAIPFDLVSILAFDKKTICSVAFETAAKQIQEDLHLSRQESDFFENCISASTGTLEAWEIIETSKIYEQHKDYFTIIRSNSSFVRRTPYEMLVTATMSAGKSTLINALTGQNLSLMQNLACTSKIHSIIGKPFDDGYTSEYDSDLVLNAGKEELLNDNEHNDTSKIRVGTYFRGGLAGIRLILHDSPGVNSSQNSEHCKITHQMLKSRKYKLLLYVLNATQLGTNDDKEHIEYVSQVIGKRPVIFVLNRCDDLITEGESSIANIIDGQANYLSSKGFSNPTICPISARAAYLARKSDPMTRSELREFNNLLDKFESTPLSDYYLSHFPFLHELSGNLSESHTLINNSGFYHFEQILKNFT